MLYLFNSGYSELYRRNLLNLLFLPRGSRLTLRYRRKNLPDGVWNGGDLPAKGGQCLISFVDRHAAGGYEYAPLRQARFLASRKEGEQLLVDVLLDEYVFPDDVTSLQPVFKAALAGHKAPAKNEVGDETQDEHYVISASESPEVLNALKVGDAEWVRAAEYLSAREVFAGDAKDPVFVRAELLADGDKAVAPRGIRRKDAGQYRLSADYSYMLRLSYRHFHHEERGSNVVDVNARGGILWGDEPFMAVEAAATTVTLHFSTSREPEGKHASVGLAVGDRPLLVASAPLTAAIVKGLDFWYEAVALVVGFAIVDFLSTDNHASLLGLTALVGWGGVLLSVLKAAALVRLVVLFGKKPV